MWVYDAVGNALKASEEALACGEGNARMRARTMKDNPIKTFKVFTLPVLMLFTAGWVAHASVLLPMSRDEHIRRSAAVFRGSVVSAVGYEEPASGFIYTRTVIRVDEVFKGKLPATLRMVYRGGEAGGRGEMNDLAPQLRVGEERLFLVGRRADGTLYVTRGQAGALLLSASPGPGSLPARDLSSADNLLKALR